MGGSRVKQCIRGVLVTLESIGDNQIVIYQRKAYQNM